MWCGDEKCFVLLHAVPLTQQYGLTHNHVSWLPLFVFLWGILAVFVWVCGCSFGLGFPGFRLGWGGSDCGSCCFKVPSDVGLPVGLSVGLVTGMTTACATDHCDAVLCFVSWALVEGVPHSGPKVLSDNTCSGFPVGRHVRSVFSEGGRGRN